MTEKLFTGTLNNKKKTAWFVSDLVRNSEDGFSHDASQFVLLISQIPVTEKNPIYLLISIFYVISKCINHPLCCDYIMKYSRLIGFSYFYRPLNIILSADWSDYIKDITCRLP